MSTQARGSNLIFWGAALAFLVYAYLANRDQVNQFFVQSEQEVFAGDSASIKDAFKEALTDVALMEDLDGDGLDGYIEYMQGSDVLQSDTDKDGYSDYEEFVAGYDPTTEEDRLLDETLVKERAQQLVEQVPALQIDPIEHFKAKREQE